ncbi:sugar phosphate isomerase/epimerase family protein [Sphaerisporangium sp. NPDC051017]|uniref:sugar phosphate isomerase/epimerase family protein n=1 Tax=Sphaerisporangium sp. NPDC051017 TaxID=3154636 RepID=UPI00343A576D
MIASRNPCLADGTGTGRDVELRSATASADEECFPACLNPATLSGLPVAEFLDAARQAGFGLIEMSIQQARAFGLDRLREALQERRLSVAAASGILPADHILPAPLLIPEAFYQAALASVRERLEAMSVLCCPVATIVVNPRSSLPCRDAGDLAVRRLRELANACEEFGLRLAVEAVGVRRGLDASLGGQFSVCTTPMELDELIQRADHPALGVLVDSYHWAATGGMPEQLTDPQAPIVHVQIADTPRTPGNRTGWTDEMRHYPGTGSLDWPLFRTALAAAGYLGPVSVELFNPQLRAAPVADIAARSLAGARACFPGCGS